MRFCRLNVQSRRGYDCKNRTAKSRCATLRRLGLDRDVQQCPHFMHQVLAPCAFRNIAVRSRGENFFHNLLGIMHGKCQDFRLRPVADNLTKHIDARS